MSSSFAKSLFVCGVAALPVPVIAPFVVESIASGSSFGAVLSSDNAAAYYLVTWALITLAALVSVSLSLGKPSGTARSAHKTRNTQANSKRGASSRSHHGDAREQANEGPLGSEEGVVKWFNVNKGFGFITTNAGEDIFVHFRSIQGRGRRSLRQGQSVRFDISEGDKGLQADNVSVQGD